MFVTYGRFDGHQMKNPAATLLVDLNPYKDFFGGSCRLSAIHQI
jgi:hypothetical protein